MSAQDTMMWATMVAVTLYCAASVILQTWEWVWKLVRFGKLQNELKEASELRRRLESNITESPTKFIGFPMGTFPGEWH